MFENPECTDCELHKKAKHVCIPSVGPATCKLAIFLDVPNFLDDRKGRGFQSENAEFVRFNLRRMSVDPAEVYFDYIVKCCPGKLPGKKADRMTCVNACSQYRYASLEKMPNLKALVVLGGLGCEAMTMDKTIGNKAGSDWVPFSMLMRKFIPKVWVGYSPGLVKEKPAESGSIFRVLWMAAEEAGYNCKVANIKPYEFDV